MHYQDDIPDIIPKKEYFKILNRFSEVVDNYPDKFRINIYYLEDNLCKIIVRRLGIKDGWGKDLKIVLYSYDELENETISIGSNEYDSKIMEIYTDITLVKDIRTSQEGKHFIHTNKPTTYSEFLNFTNIIDNNIKIEYRFFNIPEQRIFIKTYLNNALYEYDSIKDRYIKNMFFIYRYLYLNGGYYIDHNINLLKPIDELYNNIFISEDNKVFDLLICNSLSKLDEPSKLDDTWQKLSDNYIYQNTDRIINQNEVYYKNIFNINKYKFIVNSNINSYIIEYLNLNYYILKSDILEDDILITCINTITDKFEYINVNKNDSKNFIFKIDI